MEKRTLRGEHVPACALYRIAWNGGGELPDVLKSMYTSPAQAERAIEVWMLQNHRQVEIENREVDEVPRRRGRPKKLEE